MNFSTWNRNYLKKVSRTFDPTIALLPKDERQWISVAYLLCRILDSLEDHSGLTPPERQEGWTLIQSILKGSQPPQKFTEYVNVYYPPQEAFKEEKIEGLIHEEVALSLDLPLIWEQLPEFPEKIRESILHWCLVMAEGMEKFSKQPPLFESISSLQDYCYCVAGTVGEMLADCFCVNDLALRKQAASYVKEFGEMLQLTNILKDSLKDWNERGICYLPKAPIESAINGNHEAEIEVGKIAWEIKILAEESRASANAFTDLMPMAYRPFCRFPAQLAERTLQRMTSPEKYLKEVPHLKIRRLEALTLWHVAQWG